MAKKDYKPPHNRKLTDEQREEVCRLFFEEGVYQKDIAKQFGVTQSTISDTVNHPDNLTRMLKRTTAEKVRTQIRINNHLMEAADVQIELMRGQYEDQYKYLKQNAARDILDRGGVRAEKEDNAELQVNVSIGGMKLGVPNHSQDNGEDSETEAEAKVEAKVDTE